jgi:hypothetical protein
MIVAMLPAFFRFAQCLRRYRDSKEAFPHLANAGMKRFYFDYFNSTFLFIGFEFPMFSFV